MKGLPGKKILILMLAASASVTLYSESDFGGYVSATRECGMFIVPSVQKMKAGVKKPQSAKKAQKAQEKKEAKMDRDYEKYVKENRKHALEIQTPTVRERMKQNVKDADANYRAKKKTNSSQTRKGAKKYRR